MLKEKINEDFKAAFKGHEEARLLVLKNLKAAMLNKEKDKEYQLNKQGKDAALAALTDEDIIEVVSAETKKLRDAMAMFEQGGRSDLVEKNAQEIKILSAYLPAQLSEGEVKSLVAQAVSESGATSVKDMGKVMGVLMPKVKGKADGTMVSRLVKEALQG